MPRCFKPIACAQPTDHNALTTRYEASAQHPLGQCQVEKYSCETG